jgi:hypothetical protein
MESRNSSKFSGVCDIDVDECKSNPCQNGAKCLASPKVNWIAADRYKCECKKGFDGFNCANDINECASSPCQNGGSCRDSTSTIRNDCQPKKKCHLSAGAKQILAIQATVPKPHTIDWDANKNGEIAKGGGGMYDKGNHISTSLCSGSRISPYTDGFQTTRSTCFGENGTYQMEMNQSVMIVQAVNNAPDSITLSVTGNTGADNYGKKLTRVFESSNLKAFVTSVC